MTSETLQKARQAQPFQPFVIHMADGREIPVTHPELIAYKAGTHPDRGRDVRRFIRVHRPSSDHRP